MQLTLIISSSVGGPCSKAIGKPQTWNILGSATLSPAFVGFLVTELCPSHWEVEWESMLPSMSVSVMYVTGWLAMAYLMFTHKNMNSSPDLNKNRIT